VNPEDIIDGEIIPPGFLLWMKVTDLHMLFEEIAETYGRQQAEKIWNEIPQEHEHA
jgi:hypothetical protein